MSIQMKIPDPQKAKDYFQNKISFTTGPAEVQYMRERGEDFNLIDVRAAKDFEKEHVPGAKSLPQDRWETLEGLDRGKINILYCYSAVCHLAATAAVLFAGKGFPVVEMDGGFGAWKDMDLETESEVENPAA